jgi:hypothetical protein
MLQRLLEADCGVGRTGVEFVPRKCGLCIHDMRKEIEQALLCDDSHRIFNPGDEPQAKLALEVIETPGQEELTRDERKTRVELLTQPRMAEPQEEEYPSIPRET